MAAVRKALKAGFTRRVEAVVKDDTYNVLLVDGRNLAPIIRSISGTELVMRTFVGCEDYEAARREVAKNGEQGDHTAYQRAFARTKKRNHDDATRAVDPVVPDEGSVDYWHNDEVSYLTTKYVADTLYEGDWDAAIAGFPGYMHAVRRGAGQIAAQAGRQVHFDTTYFNECLGTPKKLMLQAADVMFEEALAYHSDPTKLQLV